MILCIVPSPDHNERLHSSIPFLGNIHFIHGNKLRSNNIILAFYNNNNLENMLVNNMITTRDKMNNSSMYIFN